LRARKLTPTSEIPMGQVTITWDAIQGAVAYNI
jgi:hypothetical protein